MTREIKFRAWDRDENEMLYPANGYWYVGQGTGVIQVLKDKATLEGMVATELGPMINGELMQFTGLRDKNGVEIYEGDIVQDKLPQFRCWIDYKAPQFYLRAPRDRAYVIEVFRFDDVEVIGNIYENPELLEDNE